MDLSNLKNTVEGVCITYDNWTITSCIHNFVYVIMVHMSCFQAPTCHSSFFRVIVSLPVLYYFLLLYISSRLPVVAVGSGHQSPVGFYSTQKSLREYIQGEYQCFKGLYCAVLYTHTYLCSYMCIYQCYATTMGWLRCHLSFSLLWSEMLCIRGSRSHTEYIPKCPQALDLAISETRASI